MSYPIDPSVNSFGQSHQNPLFGAANPSTLAGVINHLDSGSLPWTSAGADFRTAVVNEINSLGSSGTVAQIQSWLQNLTSNDLTNSYSGITQTDVDNVFNAAGVSPIPQLSGSSAALQNMIKHGHT